MKTTKFLTLAVVTAALAACASQKPAQPTPSGQAPTGYQAGKDENLNSYPSWKVPSDRTTQVNVYESRPATVTYIEPSNSTPAWSDYSRSDDFQKSMSDRLETASREIDGMHGRAATGTDCERRFRYLQVLRDSLRDKVGGLKGLSADAWPTKAYEVNDRMNAIDQYLAADRAACAAGR